MTKHQTSLGAGILRTAHGNGAAALLRAELPPLDEEPPPNADDTAHGLAETKRRGKPFTRGNKAAENRKPALCMLGVPLDAADPRYRSALRQANAYRQRRVRETAIACGGELGAGPSAMFASSGRALAASVVLYALAGELLAAGKTKEAADLFATASRLGDSSRQQELTAIALAEREAKARAKTRGPVDPLAKWRNT
jgi:hypothetical protein